VRKADVGGSPATVPRASSARTTVRASANGPMRLTGKRPAKTGAWTGGKATRPRKGKRSASAAHSVGRSRSEEWRASPFRKASWKWGRRAWAMAAGGPGGAQAVSLPWRGAARGIKGDGEARGFFGTCQSSGVQRWSPASVTVTLDCHDCGEGERSVFVYRTQFLRHRNHKKIHIPRSRRKRTESTPLLSWLKAGGIKRHQQCKSGDCASSNLYRRQPSTANGICKPVGAVAGVAGGAVHRPPDDHQRHQRPEAHPSRG